VAQALDALRKEAADLDVIYYIYVADQDGHLLGAVNLRGLLTNNPNASLESIMERRIVSVPPGADEAEVADIFAKYGFRALPVVDANGFMLGVIRFKAILEVVAPHLGR
jgi:magnesium transporter